MGQTLAASEYLAAQPVGTAGCYFQPIPVEATQVLALATNLTGMRSGFIAQRTYLFAGSMRILATYNHPFGLALTPDAPDSFPNPPQPFAAIYPQLMGGVPQPILITDITTDPIFRRHPGLVPHPEIGSYCAIPLWLRNDRWVGVFTLFDATPCTLTVAQVAMVIRLAQVVALLLSQESTKEQLQRIHQRLLACEDNEIPLANT